MFFCLFFVLSFCYCCFFVAVFWVCAIVIVFAFFYICYCFFSLLLLFFLLLPLFLFSYCFWFFSASVILFFVIVNASVVFAINRFFVFSYRVATARRGQASEQDGRDPARYPEQAIRAAHGQLHLIQPVWARTGCKLLARRKLYACSLRIARHLQIHTTRHRCGRELLHACQGLLRPPIPQVRAKAPRQNSRWLGTRRDSEP